MAGEVLRGRKPFHLAADLNGRGITNTGAPSSHQRRFGASFSPPVPPACGRLRTSTSRASGSRSSTENLRQSACSADSPGVGHAPRRPRAFELHGFAFCALCGATLRRRYKTSKSDNDRRYCCPSAGLGGCDKISTGAAQLERDVQDEVLGQLAKPAFRQALLAGQEDLPGIELATLNMEKASLQGKRESFIDLAGVICPSDRPMRKIGRSPTDSGRIFIVRGGSAAWGL